MPDRPADLPEFDRPPVVEVAIGVQFEPIKAFRQAHLGLFWNEIRGDYPLTQDQPRLETPIESIDEGFIPTIQLELLDSLPVHRAWFVSTDDSLLVQVQDDRLVHNWRHRGEDYPRFEPLVDQFWSLHERYQAVFGEAGLHVPPVQQAEVAYTNWIPGDSAEQFFKPSATAKIDLVGIGPGPDSQRWAARYPIHVEGELVGRLAVDVQGGRRMDRGKPSTGFQFALTFRAPVERGAERERISALLAVGREAIVRTFTATTTEPMHEEWGRHK